MSVLPFFSPKVHPKTDYWETTGSNERMSFDPMRSKCSFLVIRLVWQVLYSAHHHKQTRHSACCQAAGVILLSRSCNSCKGRNVGGQYESVCKAATTLLRIYCIFNTSPLNLDLNPKANLYPNL